MKFLLDFFTKKSRVQGRTLPLPAEGQGSRGQRPLAPAAEANPRQHTAVVQPMSSGSLPH